MEALLSVTAAVSIFMDESRGGQLPMETDDGLCTLQSQQTIFGTSVAAVKGLVKTAGCRGACHDPLEKMRPFPVHL